MTEEELLIERDQYLANGVHIGTRSTHVDMDEYIFRVKKNQLAVLNLDKTDQQIREAAEMLSDYEPDTVLTVGRKEEARMALESFEEATGFNVKIGRFMPGTLTNPRSDGFMEPDAVIVTDPEQDSQVITEAAQTNIPVVAIADSGDRLDDIDIAIPANNKSQNSLGLVYFLIARELADINGEEFELDLDDFRPEPEEEEVEEDEEDEE